MNVRETTRDLVGRDETKWSKNPIHGHSVYSPRLSRLRCLLWSTEYRCFEPQRTPSFRSPVQNHYDFQGDHRSAIRCVPYLSSSEEFNWSNKSAKFTDIWTEPFKRITTSRSFHDEKEDFYRWIGHLVESSFFTLTCQTFVFFQDFSRGFCATDHLQSSRAMASIGDDCVPYLPAIRFQTFHPHHIVDGSFLRIIQNVVGFFHLNEEFHSQLFMPRIDMFVWMIEKS